jgi:hypothetical protein
MRKEKAWRKSNLQEKHEFFQGKCGANIVPNRIGDVPFAPLGRRKSRRDALGAAAYDKNGCDSP